jgi:putative nucleotidyltransferase with HDIG domain
MGSNTTDIAHYTAVPTTILNKNALCGFDLYIAEGKHAVLFAGKSIPISVEMINKIKDSNLKSLYIKKDESDIYKVFLQKRLRQIMHDETAPTDKKAKLIYGTASTIIQELFENPETPEAITSAKSVADAILGNIMSDDKAFISMLKVSSYDYYTYTHSINVSIYAIGIGKYLNMSFDDMEILAKAGILHDLGKSKLIQKILNKTAQLTHEEFEHIKKHPVFGWEILKSLGETDERVLSAVRHHHEKLDGSGYPDGLKDGEISFFARILAVADVFDALNTRRPYKEAISTFNALREMRKKMSEHLDGEILQSFIHCMHGELTEI